MFINKLNLHLFDEGAESTGAISSDAGESSTVEGSSAESGTNPEMSFDDFIKAHEDEYKQHVEGIVKQRIKDAKATKESLTSAQRALDKLAPKYKLEAGNYEAIIRAIEADDSMLQEEAMERGVSVETIKLERQLKNENSNMKAQIAEFERQREEAHTREIIQGWVNEAKELQKVYSDFNLDTEMENKTFVHLLNTPGISMEQAYELLHPEARDNRVSSKAAQQVVQNIASRNNRPVEGITKPQQAVDTKTDVMNMTSEEFKKYKESVLSGVK